MSKKDGTCARCTEPLASRAATYCLEHQRTWQRDYRSRPRRPRLSARELILSKVEIDETTGCWNWTAALSTAGYGHMTYRGRSTTSHRLAYECLTGEEIPEGLTIDHLCFNRACQNPRHMEVVTRGENTRRAVARRMAMMRISDGRPA